MNSCFSPNPLCPLMQTFCLDLIIRTNPKTALQSFFGIPRVISLTCEVWLALLFKRFCLFKREVGRDEGRVRSSTCWFTPQTATAARAKPGQSQEPKTQSWISRENDRDPSADQSAHEQKRQNQKESQDLNSGIPLWVWVAQSLPQMPTPDEIVPNLNPVVPRTGNGLRTSKKHKSASRTHKAQGWRRMLIDE